MPRRSLFLLAIAASARIWMHMAALPPYTRPTYEAQQPPTFYSLAAPLAHLLPTRSAMNELRLWRGLAAVFALIAVIATAFLGFRFAGTAGVLAAATVVMLPTWFTLVI